MALASQGREKEEMGRNWAEGEQAGGKLGPEKGVEIVAESAIESNDPS